MEEFLKENNLTKDITKKFADKIDYFNSEKKEEEYYLCKEKYKNEDGTFSDGIRVNYSKDGVIFYKIFKTK